MIHLAGDSTLAPTDDGATSGHAELPLLGWGDELAAFLDEPVSNRAFGGATTRSFRERGNWKLVTDDLRAGDTVVFGFGHNDQKDPETLAAEGGYRERLTAFIEEVREAGAKPVLTTSVERRMFLPDGTLRHSHGPYPAEVRRLGHELDVPVIDLNAFTRWLYTWLGEHDSAALFVHGEAAERGIEVSADLKRDNTHYTTAGATAVARFVAEGLRALRGDGVAAVPAGLEMVRK